MHCSRRLTVQTLVLSRSYLHRQVSPPGTLVVKGETTWVRNGRWILPENARLPREIQGSFTYRKSTTLDKRLYFISEGRRAEDFFALKNPTASAGFEPKACTLPLDHRSRLHTHYIRSQDFDSNSVTQTRIKQFMHSHHVFVISKYSSASFSIHIHSLYFA